MRCVSILATSVLFVSACATDEGSSNTGVFTSVTEGETFTSTSADTAADSTGDDATGGTDTSTDAGDGSTSGDTTSSSGDDTSTGDGDTTTDSGDGDTTTDTGDGDSGTTTDTGDGDGDTTTDTGDGDSGTTTDTGDGDSGTTTDTGDGDSGSSSDTGTTSDTSDTGTTSDTGGGDGDGDGDECEAPANHITCDAPSDNPTPDMAVGLNCPGDQYNSTQTVAASFNSPDGNAWRIARQFGTSGDWVNTEGDQMLVISTYTVPTPDGNGTINAGNDFYVTGGDNGNPNSQQLPSPMSPVNGGNPAFTGCDGINDCSNSLQAQWNQGGSSANDLIWMDFSVEVPGGTYGWTMDFNFITAEYPNWVGTEYNDILVVWNTSEAYTGNVCFVGDEPCTVTALEGAIEDAANGGAIHTSPKMAGTGMKANAGLFETPGGGATGWYQMQGQSVPEETLEITIALFDMGDSLWDTIVLLDNWRWNCEGCDPSIPGDCGVIPTPE